MRVHLRRSLLVVLVTGCGASSPAPEQPGEHLQIIAAELRSGGEVISLKADGAVSANGRPVGRLHRDGRFFAADGKLLATLEPSGKIVNVTGYVLEQALIRPDGTLEFQGRTIRIRPDGKVEGAGDPDALAVDVPAKGRRAAMFVLLLAALSGT